MLVYLFKIYYNYILSILFFNMTFFILIIKTPVQISYMDYQPHKTVLVKYNTRYINSL